MELGPCDWLELSKEIREDGVTKVKTLDCSLIAIFYSIILDKDLEMYIRILQIFDDFKIKKYIFLGN